MRIHCIGRRIAGKQCQHAVPRNAALIAILHYGRNFTGIIEASCHDTDVWKLRIIENHRSATVPAKPAASKLRAFEPRQLAPRHLKIALQDRADHRKRPAHRLLAHATMADMNILGRTIAPKPHSATLASPCLGTQPSLRHALSLVGAIMDAVRHRSRHMAGCNRLLKPLPLTERSGDTLTSKPCLSSLMKIGTS